MARLTKPVFIVGFMGAGKTTAVRRLARQLGLSGVDSDVYIARCVGMNSADYIKEFGIEAFRAAEIDAIRNLMAMDGSIISLGGGAIESEECRDLISLLGYVVYLKITASEASERIDNIKSRPLFTDIESAEELNRRRDPLYMEVADCVIDVRDSNVASVSERICKHLRQDGILVNS